MKFATNQGFNTGDQFYAYLKDSFDVLYNEGKTKQRKGKGRCLLGTNACPRGRQT